MFIHSSFLDVVATCDNFTPGKERLIPWRIDGTVGPIVGLLRPVMVEQLLSENKRSDTRGEQENWIIDSENGEVSNISFAPHLSDDVSRSQMMKEMCERWRDEGLFKDSIAPRLWRSELYAVYMNPIGPKYILDPSLSQPHSNSDAILRADKSNYAFDLERSASGLFGIITYGVHMTIYEVDDDGTYRIWVPRRAMTKQTWPGYLDNSVAGGIPSGMGMFESIVKESMEEASFEESIIRKYARATGMVHYFHRTSKDWLQPEVEYIYDLRAPSGVDSTPFRPKPLDGEVESFELMTLAEIVPKLHAGMFKANCALIIVDFMIRHGFITPDNDPHYAEIVARTHRKLDFEAIIRR